MISISFSAWQNKPMDTSKPILFLYFANESGDRARYLRNQAEEADATIVR